MTLQDIINQCPILDLSETQVWVEKNPAYDFKSSENSILLISQPLGDLLDLEPLTLEEVFNFDLELESPEGNTKLVCEYEMKELKSSEWHGTKLMLYF
jgi:hypothetical protein